MSRRSLLLTIALAFIALYLMGNAAPSLSTSAAQVADKTPTPTFTPEDDTYYVSTSGNINVRASASTSARVVTTLRYGTEVTVTGTAQGTIVSGSSVGYRVRVNNLTGYIHSSLLRSGTPPTPVPTSSAPVQASANQSVGQPVQVQPAQEQPAQPLPAEQVQSVPPTEVPPPPPAPAGPTCPSLGHTCSQLTCEQAYACLAIGGGDLDRDNDGIPCESICGG